MPTIKPFRGVRLSQESTSETVPALENLSQNQTFNEIPRHIPHWYLNGFVPHLESSSSDLERRYWAYKQVRDNFQDLVQKGILEQDERPAIYIYQLSEGPFTQTGVWTLTSIDDYLDNTIKRHELTRADREAALVEYMEQTGIDANPVLITYLPEPRVQELIAEAIEGVPSVYFSAHAAESVMHKLWKVDQPEQLAAFVEAFQQIHSGYIADGHHRVAALSRIGLQQRKNQLENTGKEAFNFFNSVYMESDQLRIFAFNRLVKDLGPIVSVSELIDQLTTHFEIERLPENTSVFKPLRAHEFGMYIDHVWFRLRIKSSTYEKLNFLEALDVSLLQNYILFPLLHITDPRADPRLAFVAELVPIQVSMQEVDCGEQAILFTLFPASIQEVIQVADSGHIMPPKSTWITPKFQVGLVIHMLEENNGLVQF